jgi:4-hydroxybenzoate polyprenyltransferase
MWQGIAKVALILGELFAICAAALAMSIFAIRSKRLGPLTGYVKGLAWVTVALFGAMLAGLIFEAGDYTYLVSTGQLHPH